MKKQEKLHFNIDVPQLIMEISGNNDMRYMVRVLNILQNKLALIAGRAIELDDPQLNILMLETKLYEVEHSDISGLIEAQRKKIKDEQINQ